LGASHFYETSQNPKNVEGFLAGLRFEQKRKLDLVPINDISSTGYTIELTARFVLVANLSLADIFY
jgi:hypothetical protein